MAIAIAIKLKQVIYAHALRASSRFTCSCRKGLVGHAYTGMGGGERVGLTGKGGSSTSESSTTPALALSYQHGMQFSKLSIFYANSHTFQPLPHPHFSPPPFLYLAPFSKVQTVTPSGG